MKKSAILKTPEDRQMCLLLEPDEWEKQDTELLLTSKDVRQKVNPMLGIIVQHSFYDDEIAKARQNPEKMNEVICKLLNVYQGMRVTKWLTGDQIRPRQVERRITDCKYADGWNIFVGLDFGGNDDLWAVSMLGVNYRRIESNSVGYKKDYEMFSMDFEEFLWARGYGEDAVKSMLSHMAEFKPFSPLEMEVYHALFLDFNVLGGMPAVVKEYILRGTFEGSLDMQKQLIADYKEDIRKYASGVDQTRIINVFNRVAPQLARENKKFQISKVAPGARFRDYRGCAEWLADAGMVNICYCMEFPELPLGGNFDADIFKLYFADTGLLVSMLDEESQEDLRANKNLGVYKGALYENMVGEALVKQGYRLFYYKRDDSTLETDFFIRSAASLIPIEVKAKDGRAKSMKTLISSDHYPDIRYGFKLSGNNIGHEDRVYTFPYFCAFLLKRFMTDFHPEEEVS